MNCVCGSLECNNFPASICPSYFCVPQPTSSPSASTVPDSFEPSRTLVLSLPSHLTSGPRSVIFCSWLTPHFLTWLFLTRNSCLLHPTPYPSSYAPGLPSWSTFVTHAREFPSRFRRMALVGNRHHVPQKLAKSLFLRRAVYPCLSPHSPSAPRLPRIARPTRVVR
jgi:hypothetical protein